MLKPLNNQPSGLKLVNPPSKHKQGFQQELYHYKLELHNQDLFNQDLLNQDPYNQDLYNKGSHKLNTGKTDSDLIKVLEDELAGIEINAVSQGWLAGFVERSLFGLLG
ncbi:hypothetical protein LWI29_005398 [Acer saccharum]|uniref:Uncharacterized protein n=1 Tax=Acer saccharum TaxID=4024 RepID=A0AA39V6L2_ACESA|nr:hypothetical protein LWI29_005398 [Acer saccharum]